VLDLTSLGLPSDAFVVAINATGHLADAANGRAALLRGRPWAS
jgi:hypothetical protein